MKFQNKIYFKILLLFFIVLLIAIFVVSALCIVLFSDQLRKTDNRRAQLAVNSAADACISPLRYLSMDEVKRILDNTKADDPSIAAIDVIDTDGKFIFSSVDKRVDTTMKKEDFDATIKIVKKLTSRTLAGGYLLIKPIEIDGEVKAYLKMEFTDDETVRNRLRVIIYIVIATAALFILASLFFSASINTIIVKLIQKMTVMLKDISEGEGDLSKKISISTENEIGEMAFYFNVFIEKLRNTVKNLKSQNTELTFMADNLLANVQETNSSIHEITASINSIADHFNNEREMMSGANDNISAVFQAMNTLDGGMREMGGQIDLSSTSIEEMSANIKSAAELSVRADEAAGKLLQTSDESNRLLVELTTAMQSVSESSSRINEIITLIMDIAEKTNLLAMNAAIEAAHAGESGRGFAVVADEIRKLADESSKRSKDIKSMVTNVNKNIENSSVHFQNIREKYDTLKEDVILVRKISHEVSSSMREQTTANQSILTATTRINTLSKTVVEQLDMVVKNTESVNRLLQDLLQISDENTKAVDEERIGLTEVSGATEQINTIAQKLSSISKKVDEEFKIFKTDN